MPGLILVLLQPFIDFVTPLTSRFHLVWQLSGLVIAALFIPRTLNVAWTSLRAFFAYCFPARVYRHRSSALDLRFFVVNQLGERVLGWSVLFVGVGGCTRLFRSGLEWLHVPSVEGGHRLAVNLMFSFFTIVALDLAQYVSHWLGHKVPALWEFHKVHHAAEVLNPLTNYREHPVDGIVRSLCEAVPVGLVNAIFFHCFPQASLVTVLGINIIWIPFNLTANLRHTHVWLTFPEKISRWFISPAMHQVHHGSEPHHVDVNFGRVFTLWDHLGGTYYLPKRDGERIVFGLGGEEREFQTVAACYFRPFMNLGRGIAETLSSWRRSRRRLDDAPQQSVFGSGDPGLHAVGSDGLRTQAAHEARRRSQAGPAPADTRAAERPARFVLGGEPRVAGVLPGAEREGGRERESD